MKNFLGILGIQVIFLVGCMHKPAATVGLVELKVQFFDGKTLPALNPVFTNRIKMWFKDSLSIQEHVTVHSNTEHGKTTEWLVSTAYTYIDPRSHLFYLYKTFSDTASLIKRSKGGDSTFVDDAWNFYAPEDEQYLDSPQVLADTLINEISHKRIKYNTIDRLSDRKYTDIAYFRCDKKGALIFFNKNMSKKIGCPMFRIDYLPFDKNENPYTESLDFLRDSLTAEEIKVFNAWEKNAKADRHN
ncbi:MAG: hypothetical protein ABI480_03360 [Chitinophagaceae bacterium]